MPQSPDQQSSESTLPAGFGANDWLVDEMFDRYTEDPDSVPQEWATWFADHGSSGGGNGQPGAGRSRGRPHRDPGRSAEPAPATRPTPPPRPTPQGPRREARSRGPAPTGGGRGRARQGHDPPGRQGPDTAGAGRGQRPADVHGAARRPRADGGEHGRLARRADRDLGAVGAGEAALGQPGRHQQPPRPRPRRQGVVHPHHRLRPGQGAARDARDERRLRRRATASRT